MDFQPGTLLDSPLVATIIRIAPLLFAGAVLLSRRSSSPAWARNAARSVDQCAGTMMKLVRS